MKYVYMLRAGHNHYKVGVASNVYNRIKSIQTSNPSKISIITTNLVKEPTKLERNLHKWMEEYKTDGGVEWFKLTDKQALELAVLLNNTNTIDLADYITMQSIANMQANILREFVEIKKYARTGIEKKQAVENQNDNNNEVEIINETLAEDERLTIRAIEIIKTERRASTSFLQRKLSIGYGRASRIMDQLENQGIIGPLNGAKPRQVLIAE